MNLPVDRVECGGFNANENFVRGWTWDVVGSYCPGSFSGLEIESFLGGWDGHHGEEEIENEQSGLTWRRAMRVVFMGVRATIC